MAHLPIHLELTGVALLVVGAGPVGRRRVLAALDAGARVRWVAPDVPLEGPASVEARARAFLPDDLLNTRLVFACADAQTNEAVVRAARLAGVWVCRADRPAAGDFVLPARIRRGALSLGLATGGVSPAATAVLRQRLEALLPARWGTFVEVMGAARGRLDRGSRRTELLRRVAPSVLAAIMRAPEDAEGRAVEAAGRALLARHLSEE